MIHEPFQGTGNRHRDSHSQMKQKILCEDLLIAGLIESIPPSSVHVIPAQDNVHTYRLTNRGRLKVNNLKETM